MQGSNRDYALVNRARLSAVRGDWEGLDTDLAELTRLPAVIDLLRCEARAEGLLWRGDANSALGEVVGHAETMTPRLLKLAAPLAWLGARALADVVEVRQADGKAGDRSAWAQTEDSVVGLVQAGCGPESLPGYQPAELRLLCDAELSRLGPRWRRSRAVAEGGRRARRGRAALPVGLRAVAARAGAGRRA